MNKQNQLYSIFATFMIGLSVHSVGQAQDMQDKMEKKVMPAAQTMEKKMMPTAQSEEFEPVITLFSASSLPSSWEGQDVALRGNDVVSYFQAEQPLEGSEKYTAQWDNTTWHFSSEENRDLFEKNPDKYVPAFGGYCPVALSKNMAKVGFTKQYTVVDEKLYLNYNQEARDEFRETPKEYIVRAQLTF